VFVGTISNEGYPRTLKNWPVLSDSRHPEAIEGFRTYCGLIPDYLEPATSPHHRQFCHSAVFAAALIAAMKKLYDWVPATSGHAFLRDALLSIGFGYLAHLGADATTAMGLPLIGKFN
jgi:membrane-bound metal-dependent hydrolase YbcI (DUF457 family)